MLFAPRCFMTIFRLYIENGCHAGFWVQHRSWRNECALVTSVTDQTRGSTPAAAPLPGDQEVRIDTFDVRSGRPALVDPLHLRPDDRNYVRIAEPNWHHA